MRCIELKFVFGICRVTNYIGWMEWFPNKKKTFNFCLLCVLFNQMADLTKCLGDTFPLVATKRSLSGKGIKAGAHFKKRKINHYKLTINWRGDIHSINKSVEVDIFELYFTRVGQQIILGQVFQKQFPWNRTSDRDSSVINVQFISRTLQRVFTTVKYILLFRWWVHWVEHRPYKTLVLIRLHSLVTWWTMEFDFLVRAYFQCCVSSGHWKSKRRTLRKLKTE